MLPNVEYIKTLVNGLKEFVNSKIKLVRKDIDSLPQADWNQNDPTAKDYVNNRPGGYDVVASEKIISEWRMTGSNYVTIELSEPLVKGRSYRLTFSENADYSNPVFDSEVVASIDDPDNESIYITVKGYASVEQPVTYPEDPAIYTCNNDVRSGYCRLIALANTETVKIPDKYTNAITYTPQTLTDAQKKQARENVDAASDFVIKAMMGSGNAITLDKTFEQIQEAINDGKKVLVDMAQGPNHSLLPLISNTPDSVLFVAIGPDESKFYTAAVLSVMVTDYQVYFYRMEMPVLDPNGNITHVAYILKATQGNFSYWYIDDQSIEEWYTKIKENPSNYPILCLYKGTYDIKYEYEGPLFLYSITDTEIIYKRTLEDGNWVGFKLSAVDGSPSKNGFIKGVSKEFILASSTADSTKKFKITVDDSGTITTMEV